MSPLPSLLIVFFILFFQNEPSECHQQQLCEWPEDEYLYNWCGSRRCVRWSSSYSTFGLVLFHNLWTNWVYWWDLGLQWPHWQRWKRSKYSLQRIQKFKVSDFDNNANVIVYIIISWLFVVSCNHLNLNWEYFVLEPTPHLACWNTATFRHQIICLLVL